MLPASQARHHKIVHLVELPVGVPRPEIVPPAAKHGRQFRDDLLHFLPVLPLVGQLSHAIPKFLRRLRTGPPLHEMPTGIPLDAPPLTNRASQEYEALFPTSQVHRVFTGCTPMAAASHLPSVCIAASPGQDDVGLPSALPSLRLPLPRRRCCALASMLPAERRSCRSGRTMHGIAPSYSAWHTHIACVGVVVLFQWGALSSGLRASRLCPTWLPGRASPVPRCSVPACRRAAPVPFQDAVYCLRRDMRGSALPNTFRLII